ncbi:uncharacterized protein B0T15DRAFT_521844 [Chaetomium strumarium]|uniref:Uncharacterized protein n=1 Tax=Chaetomium strumarium TaxID=1170767 RepID=A0AAJ0M757_9PEZI|nr:hypothetical protein B0T15DRAFT_521844 [Chaetomium strumarium]
MVFIPPRRKIRRLEAYLLEDLSQEELRGVKRAFELGACSRFNPLLELNIQKAPEEYLNQPHSYIRIKETEAGRQGPFVLIDKQAVSKGAVWYIAKFATEDDLEYGQAESTSVLWKILVKIDCLPLTWINYDIGNTSIVEDLGNCGVDYPVKEDFAQPEVYCCGGLDMVKQQYHQPVWVTAVPGEFEESTGDELRKNFLPRPEKLARLKEGVAEDAGLVNQWTIPTKARSVTMPDGSVKEFPEGSVVLQLLWNPDFPWPEYKWPEGSR